MGTRAIACVTVAVSLWMSGCGEERLSAVPEEPQPGGTIIGNLCDRSRGLWLEGALVSVDGHPTLSTIAEVGGAFRLEDVPPGDHTLTVTLDSYVGSRSASVRDGEETDIGFATCIPDKGNIEGVFCDPGVEAGLANADVSVNTLHGLFETKTNAGGYFLLEEVPVGEYQLQVTAPSVDWQIDVVVKAYLTASVGEPACGPSVQDSFTQGWTATGQADILFVVDDSASMEDEQERLSDSFRTFVAWLSNSTLNFNLAVTTTDVTSYGAAGEFVGSPGVLTGVTPGFVTDFTDRALVGTDGDYDEQGLEAAKLALSEPLVSGANGNFLRTDARLYLIFVSDEDDGSPDTVDDYIDFFSGVKGHVPEAVHYTVIAGPTPNGCENSSLDWSADPADRFVDLVTQTNGLFSSICQRDFGTALTELALEVISSSGEYFLSKVPAVDTIEVSVDGVLQPSEAWTYRSANNSISFNAGYLPEPGSEITATYKERP